MDGAALEFQFRETAQLAETLGRTSSNQDRARGRAVVDRLLASLQRILDQDASALAEGFELRDGHLVVRDREVGRVALRSIRNFLAIVNSDLTLAALRSVAAVRPDRLGEALELFVLAKTRAIEDAAFFAAALGEGDELEMQYAVVFEGKPTGVATKSVTLDLG